MFVGHTISFIGWQVHALHVVFIGIPCRRSWNYVIWHNERQCLTLVHFLLITGIHRHFFPLKFFGFRPFATSMLIVFTRDCPLWKSLNTTRALIAIEQNEVDECKEKHVYWRMENNSKQQLRSCRAYHVLVFTQVILQHNSFCVRFYCSYNIIQWLRRGSYHSVFSLSSFSFFPNAHNPHSTSVRPGAYRQVLGVHQSRINCANRSIDNIHYSWVVIMV